MSMKCSNCSNKMRELNGFKIDPLYYCIECDKLVTNKDSSCLSLDHK